jgi:hypothetical protein
VLIVVLVLAVLLLLAVALLGRSVGAVAGLWGVRAVLRLLRLLLVIAVALGLLVRVLLLRILLLDISLDMIKDLKREKDKPAEDVRPVGRILEVGRSSAAEGNHPAGRGHCRNNRWRT